MNTNKLDCATVRVRLSAVHDGEGLDDDSRAGVLASHVASCAECREFERKLASLGTLFDSLRNLDPPSDLADTLLARAKQFHEAEIPQVRPDAPNRMVWAIRAAAGLIGFLSIFAVDRMRQRVVVDPERAFPFDRFAQAGRAFLEPSDIRVLPERELLMHVAARTGDSR